MSAALDERALCHLDDIPEGTSLGIERDEQAYVAIKKRGQVYLYRNSCPHIGSRLEWQQHQFLDADKMLIQCANHGALFRIDNGLCVAGPCIGDRLDIVEFKINENSIFLLKQHR